MQTMHRLLLITAISAILLGGCNSARTAANCEAPPQHWRKQAEGVDHHAIINRVRLEASGELRWNGQPTNLQQINEYLSRLKGMDPIPFIILEPDPAAKCSDLKQLRAAMNVAYCKMNRTCGEGRGEWQPRML